MGTNCSNITYPDENLTEYVNGIMGPRCLDPRVATITVFFYSLIFILGCFGNLFTCIVVWRNNYMHTATNYYLVSLAISDLISLVLGLPFELRTTLTFMWPDILPESVCKLRSFVTETTSYASVLTITAFSIERWLAICFPLKVKLFSKLNRAVKVIITIWLTACVCAVPIAVYAILNRIPLPSEYLASTSDADSVSKSIPRSSLRLMTDDGLTVKDTDLCALDFTRPHVSGVLLSFSFYCFFLLPMLIICVLYCHIGVTVKMAAKRQQIMNDAMKHDAKKLRRRMTVVRMLVAVVVFFFLCWLPFHIQRLSSMYFDMNHMSSEMTQFFHMIFFVSGYFYYANSAVNPVLYNALNARFRHAFVQTLSAFFGRRSKSSDIQQQQILDVSGCMRSSCSNAAAFSNPKVSGAGAGGIPHAASTSLLNTSLIRSGGVDESNRRISMSSTPRPIGRHSRTDASRCPKLSLFNMTSATGEEQVQLRPRNASTSSLTPAAATKTGRRRSSGFGLLKPPTSCARPRRK